MSTVTTTTSWGSRVGSSFKGVFGGLILVVAAVGTLFWNEGRTIKRTKALEEASKVAVSVDAQTIDPANEDKLIHISGDVITDDVLADPEFNISLNALLLQRVVQMYQWQENTETSTTRTSGGGEETTTTYSYSKVWSDTLIDSSSFHDKGYDNPTSMPYESKLYLSQNTTLGAFSLSQDQIENLGPSVDYNVNAPPAKAKPAENASPETSPVDGAVTPTPEAQSGQNGESAYKAADINEEFTQDFSISANSDTSSLNISANVDSNDISVPSTEKPTAVTVASEIPSSAATGSASALDPRLKPFGSGYYIGDPQNAQIGDVKITFSYVATPCPTSFVAQQHGNSLVSYQAKTGKVLLQEEGIHSLEEMIASAKQSNMMIAWIIRAVGLIVIFFGVKTIFAPLETLADIVPFASSIVGFGTGIVAFCVALFLGLGAIGVGWIYYRPLIGIPLVVIAVAALFYPIIRGKKKAQKVDA